MEIDRAGYKQRYSLNIHFKCKTNKKRKNIEKNCDNDVNVFSDAVAGGVL